MNKLELLEQLKSHDWYYDYSDDHSVWRRGSANESRLAAELNKLECPHKWWDIHKALCGMILEDFTEVEPGQYYRDPEKTKYIAPARRKDLLTRKEANNILEWFDG